MGERTAQLLGGRAGQGASFRLAELTYAFGSAVQRDADIDAGLAYLGRYMSGASFEYLESQPASRVAAWIAEIGRIVRKENGDKTTTDPVDMEYT